MRVEFGGAVTDFADKPPASNADLIGLLAAAVILLFAFGSVIAMGLPLVTAIFGLGVGISLITIVAAFTDIGTLAPVLGTMIGLGVGIDYSLFIVTRYREGLADGLDTEAAVGRSVATAGSAVLFAGCTVVIAICGLAISGIPYVARLGYMAAIVVAVMMVAAITLLPAILGAIGHHIDRWQLHLGRRKHDDAHEAPGEELSTSVWARWARTVASHAWPFAIARHADPGGARVAVLQHAPRRVRRRQPPVVHDATPGLRPHRGGVRSGDQRPSPGRGRAADRERHRRHRRDRDRAPRHPRRRLGAPGPARTALSPTSR